jgi:hypothetical protein
VAACDRGESFVAAFAESPAAAAFQKAVEPVIRLCADGAWTATPAE